MAKDSLVKQSLPLSLILGTRFFGLFIVMPVLSLYALSLPGVSPILVGIAMGGYALTQVLFQIPFGFLSDKFGRKSMIALGLVIFALGSVICALSEDIYMLILGRLLQGAGAVGGVISAMIADLVKEENRTKAMAFMGATISLSFTAALILGPILAVSFGEPSLFWITAFLALFGLILLFVAVPNAPKITYSFTHKSGEYSAILKNKNLQIMNLTNFLQKGFMTLALLVIPIALVKGFDMPKEDLWQVYIPASLLGFFAMIPAAIIAEKKGKFKAVMIVGILFFVLSYLLMLSHSKAVFIFGVLVFFAGFSIHEPIMQSLASRYCKAYQKGSAMGVFTTFGYLGSFFGALLGGHLYEFFSILSIVIFVVIACFMWILIFGFLANPAMQKNLYLPLADSTTNASLESLAQLSGILEWYINESERVAVIKYDKHIIDKDEVLEFINTHLNEHFAKGE
ncbi:MFS transporter [Helicobacter winghamensis]|uniref:MFS transporter n=1 Tax=Helicobacter winghamensis TaxID=157268 RepID=A0A2N3PIC3_9HELI|nr:MFS transporter [Helicobacter winghamensis]PKT76026.1 MFS transporter [Helicobacter winghamensis]PKT76656.1 MFS transporter [Helicobacter winghamensis]PKT76775.1 MFS transporter [Helicobacter winghamensis]PKT80536.1 MFS transporter [Helicobacter winghamensis]PKT80905.1 MFS transporter [Helicobacter winghamensis]